jgi:hypothetical protein
MSKNKDRERFVAMKKLNPDYKGFRGHDKEPSVPGNMDTVPIVCSGCKRKRNVPVIVAKEAMEEYLCAACTDVGKEA